MCFRWKHPSRAGAGQSAADEFCFPLALRHAYRRIRTGCGKPVPQRESATLEARQYRHQEPSGSTSRRAALANRRRWKPDVPRTKTTIGVFLMERFVHLTAPEMGHGVIAVVAFAAALPALISVLILLVLVMRMLRGRVARTWQRRIARQARGVDARLENLAGQRAG